MSSPLPNGYKDYITPDGPGIDPNLFNQRGSDQTAVYIFTPVKQGTAKTDVNNPENWKYKDRYGSKGEVKNTIGQIFGDNRPRIVVVPYMPLSTADPVQAAEFGTAPAVLCYSSMIQIATAKGRGPGDYLWRLGSFTKMFRPLDKRRCPVRRPSLT